MDKTFLAWADAKIGLDGVEATTIELGGSIASNQVDLQGNITSNGAISITADMNIAQDTVQANSSDSIGTINQVNGYMSKIPLVRRASPYIDSMVNHLGGDTSLQSKVDFEVAPAIAFSYITNSTDITINGAVTGASITAASDLSNNIYTGNLAVIGSEKGRMETEKGIAAALAYGVCTNSANVIIGDATDNRAVLTANGGDLTITSNSALTSQARSKVQTLDESDMASGDLGIGGNITVIQTENESKVTVLDGSTIISGHDLTLNATGVTEGFDFNGSGSEADTAVGASILYSSYQSDIRAEIGKASISAYHALSVNAKNENLILSLGIGHSSGTTAENAFQGSMAKHRMDATVYADICNAATVDTVQTEITATDHTQLITASGDFATSEYKAAGAGFAWNVVNSDVQAFIGGSTEDNGVMHLGDTTIQAENDAAIVSLGIAAAITNKTVAKPAPEPDPDYGIEMEDLSSASSTGKNIINLDKAVEDNGGVGNGKANLDKTSFGLDISGEVAYNAVTNTTKAYIEGSDKDTGSITLESLDMDAAERVVDLTAVGAASFSKSATSSNANATVSGGASANMIDSTLEAYIKNVDITADRKFENIDIDTVFEDSIYTLAASAALSFEPKESVTVNVAGAVAVNQIETDNQAFIENVSINQTATDADDLVQDLGIGASSDAYILSVAGNVSGTTGNAGGASVSVDILDTNTKAYQKNTQTQVAGDVSIQSDSIATIHDFAAGVGVSNGYAAVEGTVSVNRIKNTAESYLDGGSLLSRADNINIISNGVTDLNQYGGQIEFSFSSKSIGLGVSLDVNVIDNDIKAYITNAAVTAKDKNTDIKVDAELDSTVNTYLISGGGSLGLAQIGTNIAVNDIDSDVLAYLEGSQTVIDGNLDLDAKNKNRGGCSWWHG